MKSNHKHEYTEDVIIRHWYRLNMRKSEVKAYVGMAKRCCICGKVKYEKFDWDADSDKFISNFPQYQIVDDIPDNIRDEVISILNNK